MPNPLTPSEVAALADEAKARVKYCMNPPDCKALRESIDQLRDAALAALAAAPAPTWLPIETAPKDPIKRVLLLWRSGRSDWICIGSWASSDDSPHLKMKGCPREGWMPDAGTCIPINQKDCIGWQPLPAAPDSAGTGGERMR